MSKEKPEVGDVWGGSFNKAHILFVSKNGVRFMYDFSSLHPKITTYEKGNFLSRFKYISQAKGSISDLFEVEKQDKWNEKEYRKQLFEVEK